MAQHRPCHQCGKPRRQRGEDRGATGPEQLDHLGVGVERAGSNEQQVAHTLLGKGAGLSVEQTQQARDGAGAGPRAQAIAAFAKALVETRGHVATTALDGFKAAGLTEGDLLEVVLNTAATTFTNYTNNVARTDIDFPVVALAR